MLLTLLINSQFTSWLDSDSNLSINVTNRVLEVEDTCGTTVISVLPHLWSYLFKVLW